MVILEHILVLVKMSLSGCIDDKPSWVVDAVKRERWEQEARREMAEKKLEQLQGGGGPIDMRTALTQEVLESVANFDVVPPPPPPPGGPSFIPASMESASTTVTEEEDAAAEIDRLIQETKE